MPKRRVKSKVDSFEITVFVLYQMGETALMFASRAGESEIVTMLLSCAAVNVDLQTRNVRQPFSVDKIRTQHNTSTVFAFYRTETRR